MKDVLHFVGLDVPLARSETQAVIDRVQAAQPRLTCQLTLVPSPVEADDQAEDVFLAAGPEEVAFLLENVLVGRAQLAVVEAWDLGDRLPEELEVVCIPDRYPPFDAYLNRHGRIMDEMDPGSRIGVLSARSRARMAALWPDLKFTVLRGGVDRAMATHMRRNEIDGLVLPSAVTEHLGIQGIVAEIYAPDFILPAPQQGVLLVVARKDDEAARTALAPLHSADTEAELIAERAFLNRMVPDLDMPVGALARVSAAGITITGSTGSGHHRIVVTGGVDEASRVGDGLGQQLLSHSESFADLLEADSADSEPAAEDEDAELLHVHEEPIDTDELDDLDHLRGFEDLAGVNDDEDAGGDDDEDLYEDER